MIKEYFFNYDFNQASATFEVDTEKFTDEMSKEFLISYGHKYDNENNPTDEIMKKCALEVLKSSTFNNYGVTEVIRDFNEKKHFFKIDGSQGVLLIKVSPYEIVEEYLAYYVTCK